MKCVFPIQHVDLTGDQKEEYLKVMRVGNEILKSWHDRIQPVASKQQIDDAKTSDPNGKGHSRYSRQKFRSELFNRLKGVVRPIAMYGFTIPKVDIEKILDVRKCEMPMLQAHANLVERLARYAYHRSKRAGLELDDFFNEAAIAAINAIYCFTKEKVQFSTYLTLTVRHRLLNFALENKQLSHWNYDVHELLVKYERARAEINGPATFDDLVRHMELDDKQIKKLGAVLTKVLHESEIVSKDGDDGDPDFTKFGKREDILQLDLDQQDAIDSTELTEWEQAVLAAFMAAPAGTNGWRTEVASKYVNPVTGKVFSRAAPTIAMGRIRDKILASYNKKRQVA
jgi:DNA-directed RNA polymerase specialized sigma subunit